MTSFWLVGFALANSLSGNPFLAFDYNKIYIHDDTVLGETTLIDKFLIQVSIRQSMLSFYKNYLVLFFLSYV